MFFLKKIVSPLFLPVPMCVEVLGMGLILLWFTKKQKAGKIIVSLGAILLLLLSNSSISYLVLRPLEKQYPPFGLQSNAEADRAAGSAKFIVILGGGYSPDPQIPALSQLGEETAVRLLEGIRLHKQLPDSKLLLSGGGSLDLVPEAEIMAKVAQSLGISPQEIVLESMSRDTEDQARIIELVVGKEPFLLVTSASHMPRAMALFKKLGMNPIPDATDHLAKRSQRISPDDLYPGYPGLREAERAVYEYLGLAWERLRGKI